MPEMKGCCTRKKAVLLTRRRLEEEVHAIEGATEDIEPEGEVLPLTFPLPLLRLPAFALGEGGIHLLRGVEGFQEPEEAEVPSHEGELAFQS